MKLMCKNFFVDHDTNQININKFSEEYVTFVVPNNNGISRGLIRLIKSIKNQRNVTSKIIVIDSGSTDASVEFCRMEGCYVVEIDKSAFTHSYSRNKAIDVVDTKYVIFTVNDAYFNDDLYVVKAILLMEKYHLVAVSGIQRSLSNDYHASYMSKLLAARFPHKGKIRISNNKLKNMKKHIGNSHSGAYYGLDNVNAVYLTKNLRDFKFENDTVEDMSIAKRFVDAGFKIGITQDLEVQHGHKFREIDDYYNKVKNDIFVLDQFIKIRKINMDRDEGQKATQYIYYAITEKKEWPRNINRPIKLFVEIIIKLMANKINEKVCGLNIDERYESQAVFKKIKLWKFIFLVAATCNHLNRVRKLKVLGDECSNVESENAKDLLMGITMRIAASNIR